MLFRSDAQGIIISDAGEGGNCKRNTIQNNYIYNPDFHGIRVVGCKDSRVVGNTVIDASEASDGTYDGINISSSGGFGTEVATNTVVMGNNVTSSANQHHHHFHIDTTDPDPTGTVLFGNYFSGTTSSGVDVTLGDATLAGFPIYSTLTRVPQISIDGTKGTNFAGDCLFATATTCVVTFAIAEPDTNYRIVLGCSDNRTYWWSARATTGFTINAAANNTGNCSWVIIRGAT